MNTTPAHTLVADADRTKVTGNLFGLNFPLRLEPTVYAMADRLAPDYSGGFWQFHELDNGGFFMSPVADSFQVISENGYEGTLSAEALGITACLYAYSRLAFDDDAFAEACAEHFHRLREFALGHDEAGAILAAID